MIEYLILLAGIPLGLILGFLTKDEKEIYSTIYYLPLITLVLLVGTVSTFYINRALFMTFAFMFITTLVWWRG